MTPATTSPNAHSPSVRPMQQGPARPAGGGASLDPVKLLRQHFPWLALAALIGGGMGWAAYEGLQRYMPTYNTQVIFQVSEPMRGPTLQEEQTSREEVDRFMGTQVEIMRSDQVLDSVIQDPQVESTSWYHKFTKSGSLQTRDAVRDLREHRISARVRPNTELMVLTASWRDDNESAILANAVARAYLEDLRKSGRAGTSDRREALNKRLTKLTLDLSAASNRRTQIIRTEKVDDTGQGGGKAQEMLVLTASRAQANDQVINYEAELSSFQRQIDSDQGINYPDSVRSLANNDQILRGIDERIAQLRANERQLRQQGFGDQHPDIQATVTAVRAQEEERAKQEEVVLRKTFDGMIDQKRRDVEAFKANIADLSKKIETLQEMKEKQLAARLELEQLADQITRMETEKQLLESEIQAIESQSGMRSADRVMQRRQASANGDLAFPPPLYMTVALGAFGLAGLLGGLIVLREVLDQRVRGPADIALIPRMRVLGVIPDGAEDPARPPQVETAFRDSPSGVISESFRQLRAPIAKRLTQAGHKSLLIVGGMPGSGSTTVATNISMCWAASDQRVLLIDANLRRPSVHKVFGLKDGPGLGDVLSGGCSLAQAAQPTSVKNLYVLSAGSPASRGVPERLASTAMGQLIAEAGAAYDFVVIDVAPAIVSGDGHALANRVDAVALVVRALSEKRGLVARLAGQFSDTRAEFLGVVVNGARASAGGYFKTNIKATHDYVKSLN
jgi:succinoglycan biosynthesis transport protein ExoP